MPNKSQKHPHISGWREFWNSLDYGPKGSLIALIVSFLVLAGPLILKLLLYILIIVLSMALGGLLGTLIGWIIEGRKNRK